MTRIAVIGCGAIGATIAYELSRIGKFQITLFDRQVPASGSTGAALGVLMGAICHKTKGKAWRLRQTSIQRYETLIPELESLTGMNIPVNRQGIVLLCFAGEDMESWQKLKEIRHSQGWKLEIWDRARLQELCPQIEHEQIIGAIYSPQDRQLDPAILTRALVAGAQKNGVELQFDREVETINTSVANESQLLRCDRILVNGSDRKIDWSIIAAGLGTTPLTRALSRPVDIRPVLGQALELKLDKPLGNLDFQPVITGNDTHIVPLGGGNYWVGATVEFPNQEGEVIPEPALLDRLQQGAVAFCPKLADASVVRTWQGKRPRPEGRPAPVIEQLPGYANAILATGHYRNGILLAPATACEVASLLGVNC